MYYGDLKEEAIFIIQWFDCEAFKDSQAEKIWIPIRIKTVRAYERDKILIPAEAVLWSRLYTLSTLCLLLRSFNVQFFFLHLMISGVSCIEKCFW